MIVFGVPVAAPAPCPWLVVAYDARLAPPTRTTAAASVVTLDRSEGRNIEKGSFEAGWPSGGTPREPGVFGQQSAFTASDRAAATPYAPRTQERAPDRGSGARSLLGERVAQCERRFPEWAPRGPGIVKGVPFLSFREMARKVNWTDFAAVTVPVPLRLQPNRTGRFLLILVV